jgi:hypothetical protein
MYQDSRQKQLVVGKSFPCYCRMTMLISLVSKRIIIIMSAFIKTGGDMQYCGRFIAWYMK